MKPGARRLTTREVEQIAQMRERGLSVGQIAMKFGCSVGVVFWHCLKAGADTDRLASKPLPQTAPGPALMIRNGHEVRRYTPEEDALLRALDIQGFSFSVMARRLNRAPFSIRGRLMTLARHEERLARAQEMAMRGGADAATSES